MGGAFASEIGIRRQKNQKKRCSQIGEADGARRIQNPGGAKLSTTIPHLTV
jgi:hypothetical protein